MRLRAIVLSLLAGLLLVAGASAQQTPLTSTPAWLVRTDAAIDLDFANGRYFGVPSLAAGVTITRASSGYAQDVAGVLYSFGPNVHRITDKGLLIEESRTNYALWSRDLTNAAWTKTNVTAAKDQIGPDGVTNSASKITSTAANGTVLQAITDASKARFLTCFIKRITGTGTVEMTLDNGGTWTAVTVTASWTRVSIPTQTLADPTVGLRIVTSGDAVAVDFVQPEEGTFATSPIETTTTAATRTADNVTLVKFARHALTGSASWAFAEVGGTPVTTGITASIIPVSTTNKMFLVTGTATTTLTAVTNNSGRNTTLGSGTVAGQIKAAASWNGPLAAGTGAYFTIVGNNGTPTNVGVNFSINFSTSFDMTLGNDGTSALYYNGYIKRVAIGRPGRKLTDRELRSMTVL